MPAELLQTLEAEFGKILYNINMIIALKSTSMPGVHKRDIRRRCIDEGHRFIQKIEGERRIVFNICVGS